MIQRISGEPNIFPYKKKASEAFEFNDVVTKDSSGYLTKATSATPRSEIVGLIQRTVVSTDDDYADNSVVPVDVLGENDEVEATVGTGTATQAMLNKKFDLDDEESISVSASNQGVFTISKVITTAKVRGFFRNRGKGARLVAYSQDVVLADFTDGESTSGTLELDCIIPVGALFSHAMLTDVTAFAGDASAVLTIGDGTDVDRYNTGTPSVFASADIVAVGAPSGTEIHEDAKTVKLTVTSATDFGDITGGAMTVTLFWYEAK